MDNDPAHSPRSPAPDNTAISARLAVIEERLNEIIRRLDEMKNLLATLDHVQPECQGTAED